MPSPITHMAHAQYFQKLRPELDQAALLRGAIFPDVRHMAGIGRGQTHQPHTIGLDQVLTEPEAWRAGVLLHNWTDDEWNTYFSRYGLTEHNPEPDQTATWAALKLLQERLIRDRLVNVSMILECLAVAEPGTVTFGVEPTMAQRWGALVADELRFGWMSPHWEQFAIEGLLLGPARSQKIRERLVELEGEEIWIDRLEECWERLNGLIAAAFLGRGGSNRG